MVVGAALVVDWGADAVVVAGAALVGVVVAWLCWDAEVDGDVAGADVVAEVPAEVGAEADESAPDVGVLLLAADSGDEVADEVAGVVESLSGGALGVLVGGATAGTNSVADGGTV